MEIASTVASAHAPLRANDLPGLVWGLKRVNKGAHRYVFKYSEIRDKCADLEKRLEDQGVSEDDRVGFRATLISGEKSRNPQYRNKVEVERRGGCGHKGGWVITSIERFKGYGSVAATPLLIEPGVFNDKPVEPESNNSSAREILEKIERKEWLRDRMGREIDDLKKELVASVKICSEHIG